MIRMLQEITEHLHISTLFTFTPFTFTLTPFTFTPFRLPTLALKFTFIYVPTFTIHLPYIYQHFPQEWSSHVGCIEDGIKSYPLRSFVPLGHRDRVAPFSEAASWTLGDQGHQEEYGYKMCTNVRNIHDSYTVCIYITHIITYIYTYTYTHMFTSWDIYWGYQRLSLKNMMVLISVLSETRVIFSICGEISAGFASGWWTTMTLTSCPTLFLR